MDENSLLIGSQANSIKIISEESLYTTWDLYFKSQFPSSLDYSPKNCLILVGGNNGSIQCFD